MRFFNLALGLLMMCGSAYSAEIKIGDIKYTELSDGTLEISEAKKAAGDYVIETTVTDKKGTSYTVSSIGYEAFKKAPLTSVTIPNSIKQVGGDAFKECKSLTSVKWPTGVKEIPAFCFYKCKSLEKIDLTGVKIIGNHAFSTTGFKTLTIPASVELLEKWSFGDCTNLRELTLSEGDSILTFQQAVFYGTPLEEIYIGRPIRYDGVKEGATAVNRPFNNNPALKKATVGKYIWYLMEENLFDGCTSLEEVSIEGDPDIHSVWLNFVVGLPWDNMVLKVDGRVMPASEVVEMAEANNHKVKVMTTLDKFSSLAKGDGTGKHIDPTGAGRKYNELTEEDKTIFAEDIMPIVADVLDFYAAQDSLDASNYIDFLWEGTDIYFSYLGTKAGMEYTRPVFDLEKWAKEDFLNKDLEDKGIKEDYENILRWIENYFRLCKNSRYTKGYQQPAYIMVTQLVALCGLGRWDEAAKYFPTVHKAVSKECYDYKDEYPYELTYIKDALNARGYKVTAPKYVPPKAATAKSSGSKSSDSTGDLIQFFTKKAIQGAVDRHQRKKQEKRERKAQEKALLELMKKKK